MPSASVKPKYFLLAPWVVKPGTGVNAVVLGLARAMKDRYEPVIGTFGWDAPPPGDCWFQLPPSELTPRHVASFLVRIVPAMWKVWRETRGAAAINLHFLSLGSLPVLAMRKLGLLPRVIISVHGADVNAAAATEGFDRTRYRWILEWADRVIACSHALARETMRAFPGVEVAAVWNGLAWPEHVPDERPMAGRYLVCVAGFQKKKAHDVLLRAYQFVLARHPELRLVLIGGEAPERPNVERLIVELGLQADVTLIRDLPPEKVMWWVRHAECFVLPSRDEPFGIALLEAGAVGTPVVATRVGGVPEFVRDGEYGLLCEPDEPQKLAERVFEVLDDRPAAEVRAGAFQKQVRELTWDRAFAEYERIALTGDRERASKPR